MDQAWDQWWDAFASGFARTVPPSVSALELALVLTGAAAVCLVPALWRLFGRCVTIVHELGHALAGIATGMRITGITLRMDQGGMTRGVGRGRSVWFGFWGYPAPALAGLGLVWAASAGWGRASLSGAVVVLVVALALVRNGQGVLILAGTILAAGAMVVVVPPESQAHVALAGGIGLLLGAARDWWNLVSVHTGRRRELASSDAFILAQRTGVPAVVWLAAFAAVIGGCGAAAWTILA